MILLQPMVHTRHATGSVTRVTIKSMGINEKDNFSKAISSVRWAPLFLLHTCEEKYNYYKDVVITLMDKCFTNKVVIDRELRTFIHVKRAKRFDPVG